MVSRSSVVEHLSVGRSVCTEAKAICCWSIDNFPSRPVSCSAGLIGQFSISQRSSRTPLHLGSFCKHTIILPISGKMRTWRGIHCGESQSRSLSTAKRRRQEPVSHFNENDTRPKERGNLLLRDSKEDQSQHLPCQSC
ncbi:hypothetical protein KOW79_016585 [Hemibagrus wyckioides]|uniref:Uncharacterized protein n=1 Tax=Hemibagrus wyckioides TaxID=337641 RepID=A0A9D3NEJ3_9TELE|nr:hypothetical protein KOW79_016585 [Hemibagrus wyckioides]